MAFYSILDRSIFEFALTGLEQRKAELDGQIASIRRQLGQTAKSDGAGDASTLEAPAARATRKRRRKTKMSAEGKARIAAAQRKRWAAIKKAKAAK